MNLKSGTIVEKFMEFQDIILVVQIFKLKDQTQKIKIPLTNSYIKFNCLKP